MVRTRRFTGPRRGYAPGGVTYSRPVQPFHPVGPTQGYAPAGVTYAAPAPSPAAKLTAPLGAPGPAANPDMGGGLMAQATALVNKALAPLIAATNSSYDRQQQSTAAAIAAATKEYEAAARGFAPQTAGAYRDAVGAQTGSDAALANLLSGRGTEGANELSQRLGGLGGGEIPASSTAIGQSSAAAGYGSGSADVARLLSQGASAAEYGAKLPGLAALTGLRDTSSASQALAQRRADALAQLTGSAPGQVVSLYESMLGRKDTADQNALNWEHQLKLAEMGGLVDVAKANASAASSNASLNERIRHDQATEANTAASIEERRAAAADGKAAKRELAHNTAVKNRGSQETTARSALRTLAFSTKPKPAKSTGGGGGPFGSTPTPATQNQTYQQIVRQALNLPAVRKLVQRYAYKPAQVRKILDEYLHEAGFTGWPASTAYTGNRGNKAG